MDLGIKVMISAAWAFGVLQIAPNVFFPLIEAGTIPTLPGLDKIQTEWVYVLGLTAAGPIAIWLMSRPKRRKDDDWGVY